MEAELDELEVDGRALFDGSCRPDRLELAVGENLEVVEMDVAVAGDGLEEEAPPRSRLDRGQPLTPGAGKEPEHTRMDGHAGTPGAGALRDGAQPALDLERDRRLGDDEPVTGAHGAAVGEDLARTVGDVLSSHLHETQRRDLDDVRLRPVALELRAQRLLDRLPVLRVRHVDEVDDDDPADVPEPKLSNDLRHGFEVVLDDRVLETALSALPALSRRTGPC